MLYPLTLLYQLITQARNALYDRGVFQTYQPERPRLVNVGNLTVGGTGKTPHVEMLIRTLSKDFRVATLSRGYGRKTKGFRIASPADSPATLGDEPYQLYQKFGAREAIVTVGEKRADAVRAIEQFEPPIDLVLLDDAFQHRAIKAHANLLLTDYNRLFYNDLPFPSGRMREGRQGARRANMVIVTKCPENLPAEAQNEIEKRIRRYISPATPVFFTAFRYQNSLPAGTPVTLLTGIAFAKPLAEYVKGVYTLEKHWEFPDHHDYTMADLEKITAPLVLTTEKDWAKLSQPAFSAWAGKRQIVVLPIEPYFLGKEAEFWACLHALLKTDINQS